MVRGGGLRAGVHAKNNAPQRKSLWGLNPVVDSRFFVDSNHVRAFRSLTSARALQRDD